MKFSEEEQLNMMKEEIENLGLQETTVKQVKKLNPTIRIFNVGQISDE